MAGRLGDETLGELLAGCAARRARGRVSEAAPVSLVLLPLVRSRWDGRWVWEDVIAWPPGCCHRARMFLRGAIFSGRAWRPSGGGREQG